MDRLTSMTVFAKVAASKSFSAAARELGISQATASKHVQTLEAWFGARLLHRTTRRVGLTEAGESFFNQCTRILEDMDAALLAGRPDSRPRGILRISAPVAFGGTRLGALAVEFMRLNPALQLNIMLSERPVDVIEEGYDIALRVGYGKPEPQSHVGLVIKTIVPLRFILCAAPSYLAERSAPLTPAELADHPCLTDTRHPGDVWRFRSEQGEDEVAVAGPLRSDNALLRRDAALAGAGILLAPAFVVDDDLAAGRLIALLPNHTAPGASLDLVFPTHRGTSPKLRALVAFLTEALAR